MSFFDSTFVNLVTYHGITANYSQSGFVTVTAKVFPLTFDSSSRFSGIICRNMTFLRLIKNRQRAVSVGHQFLIGTQLRFIYDDLERLTIARQNNCFFAYTTSFCQ